MMPQNHVKFIIGCITVLALTSALCGAWLLWKGFAGGGELVMTVNTAIAGMIGFLSNRRPEPPATEVPASPTVTAPVASTVTVTPSQT